MIEKMEHIEQEPDEEYKKALVKILTGAEGGALPKAIFVLDGGITEVVEAENKYDFLNPGRFRSNSYIDKDHAAITGALARVVAGAELSKVFPDLTFVATGGRYHQDEPTVAAVQEAELKQLGVKGERILLEENSMVTMAEFMELIKIANEKGWPQVAVLTSDYHTPRCKMIWEKLADLVNGADISGVRKKEFFKALADFKRNNVQIVFVGAEDILEKVNEDYRVLINEAKESDGYKERLKLEKKGIKDLQENNYKARLGP